MDRLRLGCAEGNGEALGPAEVPGEDWTMGVGGLRLGDADIDDASGVGGGAGGLGRGVPGRGREGKRWEEVVASGGNDACIKRTSIHAQYAYGSHWLYSLPGAGGGV